MGQIYYETSPVPQTDGTNIVIDSSGKINLGKNITYEVIEINTSKNL